MTYIYDIYLNFHKVYFDFYEWKKEDNILHIKKIPIIKINTSSFKDIISNKIKIDNNLLKSIINKTEINNQNQFFNGLLITDTKNVCAIKFDNNGLSTEISSITLDDEYNILYNSKKTKESEIKYNIIKKNKYILETREELTQKNFLLKRINNIPLDTLKYIYYECFDKEADDYKLMLKSLIKEILQNNYIINNKIYNILKPISTN